jgi:hypothetical protein
MEGHGGARQHVQEKLGRSYTDEEQTEHTSVSRALSAAFTCVGPQQQSKLSRSRRLFSIL